MATLPCLRAMDSLETLALVIHLRTTDHPPLRASNPWHELLSDLPSTLTSLRLTFHVHCACLDSSSWIWFHALSPWATIAATLSCSRIATLVMSAHLTAGVASPPVPADAVTRTWLRQLFHISCRA